MIGQLAEMVVKVAGKKPTIKHIPGPLGVRGRNSGGRMLEDRGQRSEVSDQRSDVPAKRGSKLRSEA